MDDAETIRSLLTWYLQTDDEDALRSGLSGIAPHLWSAFSAEAAAEIGSQPQDERVLHRRLLGEERQRREYREAP